MASPKNEGFLTDEQREVLRMAAQSAEVLSSSPRSPTKLVPEHQIKVAAGGRAPACGAPVRQVRRMHSGKLVRVKKGPCARTGVSGEGIMGPLWHATAISKVCSTRCEHDPKHDKSSTVSSGPHVSEKKQEKVMEHFEPEVVAHADSLALPLLSGEQHDVEQASHATIFSSVTTEVSAYARVGGEIRCRI